MKIDIVGAPTGLGSEHAGAELGPQALREQQLVKRLNSLGHKVQDHGNLPFPDPPNSPPDNPKLKYIDQIVANASQLAHYFDNLDADTIPLTLGGDHTIALGSVSGIAKRHKELAILWIDAHADFNTEETTQTGDVHGMVLSALAGLGDVRLTGINGFSPKVHPSRIAIVGVRSVDRDDRYDADERRLLRKHGVHVYTMQDIDRRGIIPIINEAISIITQGNLPLHVSYDIDSIDPIQAPGTGDYEPGGLTFREGRLIMEVIAESNRLASLDLVEVNPLLDVEDKRTGRIAVELICTALNQVLF